MITENSKMKKYYLVFLFFVFPSFIVAQEFGQPFHPETANSANFIHSTGHRLLWENPDSTIYNVIYFSSDSSLVAEMDNSVILYNGQPSTIFNLIHLYDVEPLYWNAKYFWRVVEYFSSDFIAGPVWQFQTMTDPVFEVVFLEDFENGSGNWTITNDGGACIWTVYNFPYPNPYQLRCNPDCGKVFAADAGECGSDILSTATLNPEIDATNARIVKLYWENDFKEYIQNPDEAYVEVSTDNGTIWQPVVEWIDVDQRNSYEMHDITNLVAGSFFKLRFRTILNGWNWWWAIDNVQVNEYTALTILYPPYNLYVNTNTESNPFVELNWSKSGEFSEDFVIQRKTGLPIDTTNFINIGSVDFSVTNFVDSTVERNQIYTYRIQLDASWSNEATAYIPDNVTSVKNEKIFPEKFILYQNYPNPFNPVTTIKYVIANPGNVELSVYDVLGRKIKTLIDENKKTGEYDVEFSGADLPSGIYFYQLRAGSFTESKKMVLLK